MKYRIWNTQVIQGKRVNFCIGDYSDTLEIMFMMINGKILDLGEGSYHFFNKTLKDGK